MAPRRALALSTPYSYSANRDERALPGTRAVSRARAALNVAGVRLRVRSVPLRPNSPSAPASAPVCAPSSGVTDAPFSLAHR